MALGLSLTSVLTSCPPTKGIPVEASADMGRQEAERMWKKNTENIQEVFDFMEELGS